MHDEALALLLVDALAEAAAEEALYSLMQEFKEFEHYSRQID